MLTYGLTTVFVVGSLWYLDLIPIIDRFLQSASQNSKPNGQKTAENKSFQTQEEAEEALASLEQWEPEVTTPEPVFDHMDIQDPGERDPSNSPFPETSTKTASGTPASFARNTTSASDAPPFPPASGDQQNLTNAETNGTDALTEEERIARIFGAAGTVSKAEVGTAGNTTTGSGESEIVPASAEKPVAGFPLSDDSFAQIDQWIAEGQYLNAHRELSQRYWKEDEPLEPLLTRLNKTAGMIYFTPQSHFMPAYEVQQGDLLQNVAPQYKLSWEYLARLNRVRPEKVRVGQKLKVIKGPFSAFVDLSDFSLTIHAHGYFVKRYEIGIGKDNSTPIGSFSVKEKLKNPKYYGSDAVIEADDPSNPLGERWIDIGDSYGIHGTIDPKSIGKAESRGCLRLNNEDVVEVYDFLTSGSEVVIRP